jgi:adenylate cyclase
MAGQLVIASAVLAADIPDRRDFTARDLRTEGDLKCAARQLIIGYLGRFKDVADGKILAEFIGLLNAVKCAITIQEFVRKRNDTEGGCPIAFRIGLTFCDVWSNDDPIDTHEFKIAAGLVDLCEPGGICISNKVYNLIEGRFDVEFRDIGEQKLHDVPNPVRVFRTELARHRPASRDPRWVEVAAVLGVLGTAIALGSTLMRWLIQRFE